jgi:REP element-mobilizing transposase RayT
MPSVRINQELNDQTYFLTLTVKNWYYILDRHNRFQILADSLRYCQTNKGLRIYAYVFMLNHLHLIATAPDTIGFVRDFKKFTSKKIRENILATEPPVLKLFESPAGAFEFWESTNMPKIIAEGKYLRQKVNYIHANPVRKQYVKKAEDWLWSSANPESEIRVDLMEAVAI